MARDVLDGYVSVAAAIEHYGVAVDPESGKAERINDQAGGFDDL